MFVSEKPAPKPIKITVDQVKLLALQRDIDEQSRPTQPAKPQISRRILVNEPSETKMEGGNGEENIPRKEKKHKKRKIFSPEIQNCSDEDGSQAKMKKEKKWKKEETEAKYKEDEGDQKKDKKKTKRKKHDSISLTIGSDEDDQMKKKKLVEHNVIKEHVTLNDESLEKKKRKKKLKDKSLQSKLENIKKEEAEEIQIVNNNPKKPKKEKVKVFASETEEITGEVPVITDGVKETKAKKKAKVMETGMNIKKEEMDVKLKGKKEKRKTEGFENELEVTEDKKIISKKKDKLIKEETVAEEEIEVKIKKKKKSKKAKEEDEKAEAEETEPKKKKKKVKENEGIEDRWDEKPKIDPPAESQSKKSKKKKNSVKEDQDNYTEAKAGGKKKKIIKQEPNNAGDFPQVEVVFLSAKTGNTDEVSINQERRKNLQMEIDEESQPQKPIALGQWSTAQFDNSQQQHKFLRLMGGFKRGFQPAGATAGGANMALGKDAQQHLQQGLLGEFERAHARRMDFSNRGAGLGFSAPSNKKFSIDINASRSIRFDD